MNSSGDSFVDLTDEFELFSASNTIVNSTGSGQTASDIWYHVWWMDLIRVVISVIVPLFGVVGNSLVILAVCKGYVKQNLPHYLIANLAVTDFLFSLQNVIFSPAPIALRYWPFGEVMCQIRGWIVAFTLAANITALLLISINRYAKVVHPQRKSLLCCGDDQIVYVLIGQWVTCIVSVIPTVWDESLTGYLFFQDDCSFFLHGTAEAVYYLIGLGIYFAIPSLLLPYLHAHILCAVFGSYNKIKANLDPHSKSSSFLSQMKLTGMLLLVYLSFLVAFLSYFTISIIDLLGHPVEELHYQIAAYLMNIQATVNFVIYGNVSIEFKNAYKKLLYTLCFCGDKQRSSTVTPLV